MKTTTKAIKQFTTTTQATREASTTSGGGGGVETTVVEDEGLGGEEVFVHHHYSDSFSLSTLISFVIMVITTLAIMKYDHRHHAPNLRRDQRAAKLN